MYELDMIEKYMKKIIYKAGLPNGTIRTWATGKFKKIGDGNWEKISEPIDETKKPDELETPKKSSEQIKIGDEWVNIIKPKKNDILIGNTGKEYTIVDSDNKGVYLNSMDNWQSYNKITEMIHGGKIKLK